MEEMNSKWKCESCGIILDENHQSCPLCSRDDSGYKSSLSPSEAKRSARRYELILIWEFAGIVALSVAVTALLLNLILKGGIGWSLYPIASAAWSWLLLTITLFLRKKILIMLPMHLLNTLCLLFIIDRLDSKTEWFISIAMPLTLLFFVLAVIVLLISLKARHKGFNILVYCLVAIAIFCIGTDLITSYYINGHFAVRWSAIVASVLIPVSGIVGFVHYRLGKGRYLDGFFHI